MPETEAKDQKSKKADFYKSDTASIEMVQGGATDDKRVNGTQDSYKSDNASIGKLKESVQKKSEAKDE